MERSQRTKLRHRLRLRLARLRKRAKPQLTLEDFDDVRYKVEIVRLADGGNTATRHFKLWEGLFEALFFSLLLGGCMAVGFAADLLVYSQEALRWLLPMLLLPLAWLVALHLWERLVVAPPPVAPVVVTASSLDPLERRFGQS